MTNYEWLLENRKDLIRGCLSEGFNLAVNKETGEPCYCTGLDCNKCLFHNKCCENTNKWLNEEHVEKPVDPHWDVDTKVLVSSNGKTWEKRYFSIFCDTSEKPYACFIEGTTSWSATGVTYWKYAKLAEE